MRNAALVIISAVLFLCPSIKANALDSCEDRFTALNDRFNTSYFELDSECYPQDVLQSGLLMCYQISDECKGKYDALWTDYADTYNTLFAECADSFSWPVVSIDPVPEASTVDVARADSVRRKKTPTQKEMSKQIQELKVKLRKVQTRLRKASRSCSRR
jgi:hypothetical protein